MTNAITRLGCTTAPRGQSPLFSTILRAAGVAQQRRQLARMTQSRLNDIGLSRAEAEAEARRPIWDVPKNWRC